MVFVALCAKKLEVEMTTKCTKRSMMLLDPNKSRDMDYVIPLSTWDAVPVGFLLFDIFDGLEVFCIR